MIPKCIICNKNKFFGTLINSKPRFCNECGSVERHRALVNMYLKNTSVPKMDRKNILNISEGKRKNGKYYETSYFFSKIGKITTGDIRSVAGTCFKDNQYYDLLISLENLEQIKDNSFDLIILNHVLTAIEYDLTAFQELVRICSSNGYIIISDGYTSNPESETLIVDKKSTSTFIRRLYSISTFKPLLSRFFNNVVEDKGYDIQTNTTINFYICSKPNKDVPKINTIKLGSSTILPQSGLWKECIFIFGLSRTGTSSLEIALKEIGYNTIYFDPYRLDTDDKIKMNNIFQENIKNNRPLLDNIDNYNSYILSDIEQYDLNKIFQYYPGAKYIITNRNISDWVISFKRHEKISERPILCSQVYIDKLLKGVDIFTKFFKDKPNSSCIFNASEGDGYIKLCNFLNKNIIDKPYPNINSNKDDSRGDLTEDEIKR